DRDNTRGNPEMPKEPETPVVPASPEAEVEQRRGAAETPREFVERRLREGREQQGGDTPVIPVIGTPETDLQPRIQERERLDEASRRRQEQPPEERREEITTSGARARIQAFFDTEGRGYYEPFVALGAGNNTQETWDNRTTGLTAEEIRTGQEELRRRFNRDFVFVSSDDQEVNKNAIRHAIQQQHAGKTVEERYQELLKRHGITRD
ncbi:MAG: hypothetical protein FWF01_03675, partial [Alphaproteobacteria bacterium]|nr:hypothetical protein [Alphaproteobacteria bacterium]